MRGVRAQAARSTCWQTTQFGRLSATPAAKTYHSREAFMSEVIGPFNARMRSHLVPAMRHLYADGDTVIAFFDASGPARDGEVYSNTYAWFLEMRDGRIVRAHAFFDSIVFDALWKRVTPA
jgi:ketosteroid isomerase-like protein